MKLKSYRESEKKDEMTLLAEAFEVEAYKVKDWVTLTGKGTEMTMEDAVKTSTSFKYVDTTTPSEIIAKETERNGKTEVFYKIKIHYKDGGYFEYDLSYNKELTKDLIEGMEIDTSTLVFHIEEKLGKRHKYATGTVIDD